MAKKIITLDPGHGKNGNKSPNNTKYIEGTQMWHLANKLKAALERYGFEVVTTRPDITDDPALEARGGMAGANGSCLFLSLHSNAPGQNADGSYDGSVTGTTVYYSLSRAENKALADQLGNKVSELMGHKYRGSKIREGTSGVDYYGVLRSAAQKGCTCAFIVEHGFHTNLSDSNWLLDDANLQKLADAEAQIIAAYFGQQEQSGASDESGTMYRVQVGAFSKRENAEALADKLKASGFDAYIVSGESAPAAPWTPAVGDRVVYRGTVHYRSANAIEAYDCVGGEAEITEIYQFGKSKHPYHLKHTGKGCTVHGYVDAGTFDKA